MSFENNNKSLLIKSNWIILIELIELTKIILSICMEN